MLKSIGFKFQVQLTSEKGRLFLSCLTDWEIRINRLKIAVIEILQNFKTGPSLQKRLEFHSNFFTYKKGTLATFFRLLEDFFVILYEI